MEVKKFGANNANFQIKHALRELPSEKMPGNEDIVPELTSQNYSLLNRCKTAAEAIKYRAEIEKEIFHFNRKNLVREVGIIVQCPSDCPVDQKADFFREAYAYICSTLPMGERCVIVAQVHVDERKRNPVTGEMISKDHLHVLFIPAVTDSKHDGFSYRLCADQLIKKKYLFCLHDGLQKHLDKAGIKATVKYKKSGDGKAIHLSVSQLKTLTNTTGITLDHSLTIEELAKIINTNILHEDQISIFKKELAEKKDLLEKIQLNNQKQLSQEATLRQMLEQKDMAMEKLKCQNQQLQEHISSLNEKLKEKSVELSQESHPQKVSLNVPIWGHESGWGTSSEWGKIPIEKDIKEDITV